MADIFTQFPNKEAFDCYWKENYTPITYEDVKSEYETFVKEAEKHIFISDYEEGGCISKTDFMDNLSEDAMFTFQDTLTEVFYEKNPEVYENAFALFEEAKMAGKDDKIAVAFHEEFNRLYQEFVMQVFDAFFA